MSTKQQSFIWHSNTKGILRWPNIKITQLFRFGLLAKSLQPCMTVTDDDDDDDDADHV